MAAQQVPLAAVERLSPACIRILGGNPGKFTLQGTNTYLVGTGRRRILIDTGQGMAAWTAALEATLRAEGATVETALLSHWHGDHTGGIAQLRRLAPEAVVYKHSPGPGQAPLADGQRFHAEGASLTAHHAPGHTADHMVFVLEGEDAMFTGDNVLGHGTAVFEDLGAYVASLERMRRLFAGRAYPGHGAVVDDGPGRIAEYVAHRRRREAEVLRAVRGAAAGATAAVDDVVAAVYRDVPAELHAAARGGVLQVLDKLEREGRVARGGDGGWRAM